MMRKEQDKWTFKHTHLPSYCTKTTWIQWFQILNKIPPFREGCYVHPFLAIVSSTGSSSKGLGVNMSMYIRLKRRNESVFMHVEPSDSFHGIKVRVGELHGIDASSIMLYADDKKKELVDLATVSDQGKSILFLF